VTGTPTPPELAEDIVAMAGRYLGFDLGPVRLALGERLAEPDEEYVWPRAERIAGELIDAHWPSELLDECERALAEAHEAFLVRAGRCRDEAEALERDGRESWIAQALRHRLAFDAAWDVITENDEVVEEGCLPSGHEA
jgi:hypothetical protein